MGKLELSNMIRKLVPFFFSAAVLFILFLIFWRSGPGPRLIEGSYRMEVDMNISEFFMVQGQEGRSSLELFSDNAGFIENENIFVLDNPVITYHPANNSDPLVVRASQGKIFQDENIVRLWPDVLADHGEIKVKSEKAAYRGGDNIIILEDNVVFSGRGITVTSPQATINLDDELVVSTGGVKTSLR